MVERGEPIHFIFNCKSNSTITNVHQSVMKQTLPPHRFAACYYIFGLLKMGKVVLQLQIVDQCQ